MTPINPDTRHYEVMRRTMCNLQFVRKHAAEGGPFEVVQLLNSFTGAMVHPWEAINSSDPLHLKKLSLEEARRRDWPVLEIEISGQDTEPACYWQMLHWTRHAIAHGNVSFLDDDNEISHIKLWNMRGSKRNWGTVLTMELMEDFLWFFYDLTLNELPKPRSLHPRIFAHAAD